MWVLCFGGMGLENQEHILKVPSRGVQFIRGLNEMAGQ